MIYLDWAATALPDPVVIDTMAFAAKNYYGNPSSPHREGKRARSILHDARKCCAKILNCDDDQLIFTSGGTESNVMAMLSLLRSREPGSIMLSMLEHPSVGESAKFLESQGWNKITLKPDAQGIIKPEKLLTMLEKHPDTRLIAIMKVSNEIGVIQPIDELADVIKGFNGKRRIHFHVDLVQAAGKVPINLGESQFDTASLSAHKFRGPRGIGLLYRRSLNFNPIAHGGGQEFGIRPGTENVAGAMAMALAIERHGQPSQTIQENGTWLIKQLAALPDVRLIPGSRSFETSFRSFVPGIIAIAIPPLPGEVLARVLETSGFAVSAGSACRSNRKGVSSHPLTSMGLPRDLADGMIRISIGSTTPRMALRSFIEILKTHIATVERLLVTSKKQL